MSRLYSKSRVAEIVDQITQKTPKITPAGCIKPINSDAVAKNKKGKRQ